MRSKTDKIYTKQLVNSIYGSSERCEEATLLQLAKLGGYLGEQARSRLVVRHYDFIKARCLHTLRDPADASDAAQEASIKMFHALATFEGRSALRTWLSTIVQNECMNVIRKRKRAMLGDHLEALLDIHQRQLLRSTDKDPDAIAKVQRVLKRIPSKSREALLLRFFKELSLEEMSKTLNLNLSATKMRLYRAMQQFREHYDEAIAVS